MTRWQRLLDSSESSDFERWLLDSAARERPSPSMLSQLRASLDLDAVSTLAKHSVLSSIKTTLLALSLGTLMGVHTTEPMAYRPAAASQVRTSALRPPGPQAPRIATTFVSSQSSPDSADLPVVSNSVRNPDALVSPKATRAVRTRQRESVSDSMRTATGPDLREEIRLLDLARSAVKSQKPEAALASLDVYSLRFPAGAFRQEASMLRMQALAERGDVTQASSMAKQFVETHPNSPYLRRASNIAKGSVAPEAR